MKASSVRDLSQIGLIDYLLVSTGSALAVYSAGMAISVPRIGTFSVTLILVGTLFSYFVRILLGKTSLVTVDGVVYAGAIVASIVLLPRLNASLPEGGFPREVMLASVLSWMLILGSFCAWRDGTLLFQAIPAIALFGLVGCYDTFRGVVYAFFGFLTCLATLFARTHTREMLQQAVDSGWFNRADAPGRSTAVQRSMALYDRIKEGPWKWLAGPEWALASALAVIFVSLIGAPVIRESVREVSGTVKLAAPPIKSSTPAVVGNVSTSEAQIGRGPITALSDAPLYEAHLDHLRYLRGAIYDIYNGDGWRSSQVRRSTEPFEMGMSSGESPEQVAKAEILKPVPFNWSVRPTIPASVIPMPGEVVRLSGMKNQDPDRQDGSRLGTTDQIVGTSIESAPSVIPKNAVAQLPTTLLETTSLASVPEKVKDLARQATRGAKDDYERAEMIKDEIARHARYNLKAAAVPTGRDPVEYFLFESHEGYCDLFASSMVVMARSVGIPARYVTGFLPDASRATNDTYVVVDADAHAWAELFFEGVGWVVFDATENAEEVKDAGRGAATVGPPWYQSPIFLNLLNVLIVIGVGAIVLYAVRVLRAPRDSNLVRKQLGRMYSLYVGLLERKARVRRQPSATPNEFLASVLPYLNGSVSMARDLNGRFVRAFYAPDEITAEQLAQLKADLRNFGTMVRKERSERRH